MLPLKGLEKNPSGPLPGFRRSADLGVTFSPISASILARPSLCVDLCHVFRRPSKDTGAGFRAPAYFGMTSAQLITLAKTLFLNEVRFRGSAWTCILGTLFNPLQTLTQDIIYNGEKHFLKPPFLSSPILEQLWDPSRLHPPFPLPLHSHSPTPTPGFSLQAHCFITTSPLSCLSVPYLHTFILIQDHDDCGNGAGKGRTSTEGRK